ncbi:unnamed protein product [Rhizophagus irregularis]|nr:unnamed protein product [Rhizophagus irregularis]
MTYKWENTDGCDVGQGWEFFVSTSECGKFIRFTQCDDIIWANISSTLGINNIERKLMFWGFDDTRNKIISPTHFPAQNIMKYFGDDNGIQGYLDINGNLYGHSKKIFNLPAKCVDVAQMWTGSNVIAVTMDGKLWQFNLKNNEKPKKITAFDESGSLNPFFTNVVCGENHSLALTRDGEVFSWGSGRFGQLGHGEFTNSLEKPTSIEFFQGLRVKEIACGGFHSAVITDSGDLYTFGWNHFGRLGISSGKDSMVNCAEPSLIEFGGENDIELNVLKVACGSAHTVAITDDYRLWSCGWGKYGQLGLGADRLNDNYLFVQVDSTEFRDKQIVDCLCGRWNTFLILNK